MIQRELTDLKEELEPYLAEQGTEKAQDAIYAESTHTSVLWQDGEITYRKNGDLWGRRSWHQWVEPWLPRNEVIWYTGGEDEYKVITDKEEVKEILREYAEERGLEPISNI